MSTWAAVAGLMFLAVPASLAQYNPVMPTMIECFTADSISLDRTYPSPRSSWRLARLEKFYADTKIQLTAINFDKLSQEDKVDYLLLSGHITAEEHKIRLENAQIVERRPLLPFAEKIEFLMEEKRLMKRPNAEQDAAVLTVIVKQIGHERTLLADTGTRPRIHPVVANRAASAAKQLSEDLHTWFDQYNSYDPAFTWWVDQPYKAAQDALRDYATFLREALAGITPEDNTKIIGDPVGRKALLDELTDNLIPYTPEELVAGSRRAALCFRYAPDVSAVRGS